MEQMKCPGQDTRYWKPEDIFSAQCPKCGAEIEFFKDDTTRKCPHCGHHEIGFVTQDGEFHPLRPGTPIRLDESPSPGGPFREQRETRLQAEEEEQARYRVWVPEPFRGDRELRRKYSVMVKEPLFQGEMSGGLYELAYAEKLERLIEKELDIPLPVLLDRFFAAPHLASGNPRQTGVSPVRALERGSPSPTA